MATFTTNYNLQKDASIDYYDIATVNNNLDLIDAALASKHTTEDTGDGTKYLADDGTYKNLSKEDLVIADYVTHTQTEGTKALAASAISGAVKNFEADGLSLVNSVINGDFSDGATGWSSSNSTLSVTSNVLSATSSGTSAYPIVKTENLYPVANNDIWFIYSKARVTNSLCQIVYVNINGTTGSINTGLIQSSPVINTWYEIYEKVDIATSLTGYIHVLLGHGYADASTASGKVLEVDGNAGVFAINMTALGIESYTEAQMLDLVHCGYFEGLHGVENANITIDDGTTSSTLSIYQTLKSLTNGVKDRVYYYDGALWMEKNVQEYVLKAEDIDNKTTRTNAEQVYTTELSIGQYPYEAGVTGRMLSDVYREAVYNKDNYAGVFSVYESQRIYFTFPIGTTLEDARTALTGIKIQYQLATPQLINLTEQGLTDGELFSIESGTVYNTADKFHSPSISFDAPINLSAQLASMIDSDNYQSKLIASKANKVQEDWVEPTLLNGWENYLDATHTAGYYKDDTGIVRLCGSIKGGTTANTTALFALPTGYRPSETLYFAAYNSSSAPASKILVYAAGPVCISDTTAVNTILSLDGISFRAEK